MADVFKIWGRASSVNVQKVLWALAELERPFERVDAGGRYGVVDTDTFARMNPMRRVPVLQDGDFILWESNTILRYLGAETVLMPADAKARSVVDQWMEFTTSTLQPAFIGIFWQLVRTAEADRSPETIAKTRAEFQSALAILDERLASEAFLGGATFGLADIAAGSLTYRATDLDLVPEQLGNVRRWIADIAARPGYREHIATSYEELRVR